MFENFYSGGELGKKGFRYKNYYMEKVPIPKESKFKLKIIQHVNKIIEPNLPPKKINKISREINLLVEKVYELSKEEINLIKMNQSK